MSAFERFCEAKRVRIDAEDGGVPLPDGWPAGTHPYKVTLRYQRRSMTTPFFMGPALERDPSAADVLACLLSDASCAESSFEDWCSDLGYDADSRKALSTYEACKATAVKLARFLGDDLAEFTRLSSDH